MDNNEFYPDPISDREKQSIMRDLEESKRAAIENRNEAAQAYNRDLEVYERD